MFDLPVATERDRKEYRTFRKYLIKNGYVMLQASVYSKIAVNWTAATTLVDGLRQHKPPQGTVCVLKITEKTYAEMEYIVGKKQTEIIDSNERLVVL